MSLHHLPTSPCPLCQDKLRSAHPELVVWFQFLKSKFPDLHISWTFRDEATQNLFFDEKKTKARWPNSNHNHCPSRAMDLFRIRPDNVADFSRIKMRELADALKKENAPVVCGVDWPGGWDSDHVELRHDV